jgi:hypothetical protein
MSRPRPAQAVKPVISLFSANLRNIGATVDILVAHFGKPDFISGVMPFDDTDYYEREMGKSLVRRLVSFEPLVRPEALPDIKCLTNHIEEQYAKGDQRFVNIDPGYISPSHLILATGKGYSHRPYLREGIYADLTLIFSNGVFRPLPWTYPDYAGHKMIGLLNRVREKYLLDLKKRDPSFQEG